MSVEIFYHQRGKTDFYLTIQDDGKIIYSVISPGSNVHEVLTLEDALPRWPLYRSDIMRVVELAKEAQNDSQND